MTKRHGMFMSASMVFATASLAALPSPAIAQAGAAQAGAAQASAAAGQTMYQTDCAMCHLPSGQGGVHFGSAVSANLTSPGLEQTYNHNDALIKRAILQAKDQDGQPLDMPMPAWQGRLTDEQAGEIVAYLHTLKAPSE